MKVFILALTLFSFNFVFSQKEQDTLILNSTDILYRMDTIYNIKNKLIIEKIKINKKNGNPLNGLCKIITGKETYFISKYNKGIEDNQIFNYVKYYFKDNLYKIDIKGNVMIGSKYISIPKYCCCVNKKFKAYYIDISSDKIIESIELKQRIKKKHVIWKIYSKKKHISRLYLPHKIFNCNY